MLFKPLYIFIWAILDTPVGMMNKSAHVYVILLIEWYCHLQSFQGPLRLKSFVKRISHDGTTWRIGKQREISPALTGVYVGYIRHYHSAQSRSDKFGCNIQQIGVDIVIMVRIRCFRTLATCTLTQTIGAKNVITTITTDNHLWSKLTHAAGV